MKTKVYLADLTHTENGISALTFPLGTAMVASYAKKELESDFDFRLFKFPDQLSQAIAEDPPQVLACSNYSWNLELTYKLCAWAKRQSPGLIVVFGGPNFPVSSEEKAVFFLKRPAMDFHVENEGEVAFTQLLRQLKVFGFSVDSLQRNRQPIANCNYVVDGEVVSGAIERIPDVNIIPSPYLTGLLDEFFALPLSPMLETTRGCPFSCSFCADGIASKNKVERFNSDRVREELHYMAQRIENTDELTVTDLNFGMYKSDVETASSIAEIQAVYNWPVLVRATAGKNRPERIFNTASLLKGSWVIGSSIQSSDEVVLKNIKRTNISIDAYQEFLKFMSDLDKKAATYVEVILGLPGDTKEKHFESLRYGVESQAKSLRMFQAIMLAGTEMASRETREKFELSTKFRIIPGGIGLYKFGDETVPVVEIEEIIVGTKDLSFEDYLSCRFMNLLIEFYFNNGLCEEIFAALRGMDASVFDFFVYIHGHPEMYTPKMSEILASFIKATKDDLYDTQEDAEKCTSGTGLLESYLADNRGSNELLEHRALLYMELEDTLGVFLKCLKGYLKDLDLLVGTAGEYFDQLTQFILYRKKGVQQDGPETEQSFGFDFQAIENLNYEIDPRVVERTGQKQRFRFFHSQSQRDQIHKAVSLYANHPGGISRMLYRQNLKLLFREYDRV